MAPSLLLELEGGNTVADILLCRQTTHLPQLWRRFVTAEIVFENTRDGSLQLAFRQFARAVASRKIECGQEGCGL